jgi:hypothetical protein
MKYLLKMVFLLTVCVAAAIAGITSCSDDSSVSKLYLYSAGTNDGDLGGRSGADTLCDNSSNKPSGVSTAHAFITVSSSDTIADMPSTYSFPDDVPIYNSDESYTVGSNWADLLDSSLSNSLQTMNVTTATYWWSGSNADGTLYSTHCTNWTTNSSGIGGIGNATATDGLFMIDGDGSCSSSAAVVLCIGY